MPYIRKVRRKDIVQPTAHGFVVNTRDIGSAGELNYIITTIVSDYLSSSSILNYNLINEAIGVLECVKLELYRRIAAPYEDKKKEENGDVF